MKREVAAVSREFPWSMSDILTGRSKKTAQFRSVRYVTAEKDIRIVFVGVPMKHPARCETSFALLKTVEQ